MSRRLIRRQQGVTLVMGLLMLVLLTLLVIGAITMSTMTLRATGNAQTRNEAVAAGQQAIERVASTDFPNNPVATTVNVDVNLDGTTDYAVTATPLCLNSVPVRLDQVDPVKSVNDAFCLGGISSSTSGIVGPGGSSSDSNSVCANQQWDIAAAVADKTGNRSNVTVHQGLSRRVAVGDGCP
jgi:hypothetical protein